MEYLSVETMQKWIMCEYHSHIVMYCTLVGFMSKYFCIIHTEWLLSRGGNCDQGVVLWVISNLRYLHLWKCVYSVV